MTGCGRKARHEAVGAPRRTAGRIAGRPVGDAKRNAWQRALEGDLWARTGQWKGIVGAIMIQTASVLMFEGISLGDVHKLPTLCVSALFGIFYQFWFGVLIA